MFGSRKKNATPSFDKTGMTPVIRSSICTGEQTAGLKDEQTGKFFDIMLIRSDADLQEFLRTYDVAGSEIKREW